MWMLGAKLPGPFGTYAPSPGPPLLPLHYLVISSNSVIISPFLFKFSSFITLRFLVSFLSFHLFYVWSYWFLLFSSEKLPRIFCYSGIKLRSSHTLNPHLPAELQPQPQGCCCFTYSLYHHLLCLWCGPPPSKLEVFCGRCVSLTASALWVHVFPDRRHSVQFAVCFCESFLSPTSCWALAEEVRSLGSLTVVCAIPFFSCEFLRLWTWQRTVVPVLCGLTKLGNDEVGGAYSLCSRCPHNSPVVFALLHPCDLPVPGTKLLFIVI